jgi:acyl-CoA synthetase (AMP-forming)/AMP-acid ligase II
MMGFENRPRRGLSAEQAGTLGEVVTLRGEESPGFLWLRLLESEGTVLPLTCGDLLRDARRLAGGLSGVEKTEPVLLILPTSLDFLRAFWGVLLRGAVPVPLYPPARLDRLDPYADQLRAIVQDCEARVILTDRTLRPLIERMVRPPAGAVSVVVTADLLKGSSPVKTLPAVSPEDTALIQYTSGTTGAPKGVELSHRNILANVGAAEKSLEYRDGDVGVSWLPLYHDMGLIGAVIGTLYSAVPLILMSPIDFIRRPERWLWAIHTYRATHSAAPNFAYSLCARKAKDRRLTGLRLDSWRMALNGAEPVLPDTLRRFAERFGPYGFREEAFFPAYGLAECTLAVTVSELGKGPVVRHYDRKRFETGGSAVPADATAGQTVTWVSSGLPLPETRIRIVNEDNLDLPERQEGEIRVQGPSVMKGYHRQPEATDRVLKDGWLVTGDLGFFDGGRLFVTGRIKDVIIKGGKNYHPQDVEAAASTVSGVRPGCVSAFGVTNPQQGTEEMVVVAETRKRLPSARRRMRLEIRRRVFEMVGCHPDEVVLVAPGWVMKTSSGKLQRSLCRKRYLEGSGRGAGWPLWHLLRFYLRSFLTSR